MLIARRMNEFFSYSESSAIKVLNDTFFMQIEKKMTKYESDKKCYSESHITCVPNQSSA